MNPSPRFFGDLAFNLLLGTVLAALLGIIAFGTLAHQGDFASPFLTMMCVAPVLTLALFAITVARIITITKAARAQAKFDRMLERIKEDERR